MYLHQPRIFHCAMSPKSPTLCNSSMISQCMPCKSGIEGVTELQRIEAHIHRLSQPSCLYYLFFIYFAPFIFVPFHFSELNTCLSVWLEQCIHLSSAHLSIFEQIHGDPNTHIYTRFYRDQIHNPESIHSMRKKAFHLICFGGRGRETPCASPQAELNFFSLTQVTLGTAHSNAALLNTGKAATVKSGINETLFKCYTSDIYFRCCL